MLFILRLRSGHAFHFSLFTFAFGEERLQKLTEDYVVSNRKLVEALGEEFPVSAADG